MGTPAVEIVGENSKDEPTSRFPRYRSEAGPDSGCLERLEATMAKYRRVAEVHGALLPRYERADEDLRNAQTLERARASTDREREARRASRIDAQEQRDELERRLLIVFKEVRAVRGPGGITFENVLSHFWIYLTLIRAALRGGAATRPPRTIHPRNP